MPRTLIRRGWTGFDTSRSEHPGDIRLGPGTRPGTRPGTSRVRWPVRRPAVRTGPLAPATLSTGSCTMGDPSGPTGLGVLRAAYPASWRGHLVAWLCWYAPGLRGRPVSCRGGIAGCWGIRAVGNLRWEIKVRQRLSGKTRAGLMSAIAPIAVGVLLAIGWHAAGGASSRSVAQVPPPATAAGVPAASAAAEQAAARAWARITLDTARGPADHGPADHGPAARGTAGAGAGGAGRTSRAPGARAPRPAELGFARWSGGRQSGNSAAGTAWPVRAGAHPLLGSAAGKRAGSIQDMRVTTDT